MTAEQLGDLIVSNFGGDYQLYGESEVTVCFRSHGSIPKVATTVLRFIKKNNKWALLGAFPSMPLVALLNLISVEPGDWDDRSMLNAELPSLGS